MEERRRVAIFARVALDDGDSLERQTEELKKLVYSREDWELVWMYARACPARRREDMEDVYKALLRVVEEEKIELLVMKGPDRLSRNTVVCLDVVDALEARGCQCYFADKGITSAHMITPAVLGFAPPKIKM